MRDWGSHSYEKIAILADYLEQFARAASRAPNRVYIDAFAGETQNLLRETGDSFAGSAEIALSVEPPFTHVLLFERGPARAEALRRLAKQHESRSVEVYEGDCNKEMKRALAEIPEQAPAFAFLDPDGMELHWSTIRQIADRKRAYAEQHRRSKVEMWILFSTAGIVRMLGSNRSYAESRGFPDKIARLYGAWGPWQRIWEARLSEEMSPGDAKRAYLFLYMDRLAELGYEHLLARPIHTSRNELYAMVFASDSMAGSRIMGWAQARDRIRPRDGTLFDLPEPRPQYEDLHTGWRDELPFGLPDWDEYDWDVVGHG